MFRDDVLDLLLCSFGDSVSSLFSAIVLSDKKMGMSVFHFKGELCKQDESSNEKGLFLHLFILSL